MCQLIYECGNYINLVSLYSLIRLYCILFPLLSSPPFPVQLILGLPIFLKFAGAAIVALKRWLHAEEIDEDSEGEIDKYFSTIHTPPYVPRMETFAYAPLALTEKRTLSSSMKAKPSSTSKKMDKGNEGKRVCRPVLVALFMCHWSLDAELEDTLSSCTHIYSVV